MKTPHILLIFLLAIYSKTNFAQVEKWAIAGQVKNGITGVSLAGASIFISNSTKGTTSDSDGKFTINGLSNGNYNVLVSFVGFETQIYPVSINNENDTVLFSMKDTAKELEGVVINLKNGNRNEQLKIFRQGFIGTDKNAKQTDITNEEILKMHTDESGKIFHAHSNNLLLINNDALGYRIKYLLKDFYYNKKTGDLHYIGYPLFEEMKPTSASEKKKWEDNREKVYQFSSLRFYRTLGKRNLIAEGYIVGNLISPEEAGKVPGTLTEKNVAPSNGFSLTILNQQYIDTLYWPEIPYYKIMTALPRHKYRLNFSGIMSVDATGSHGEQHATDYYKPGPKTSLITLKEPVEINQNGIPDDASKVIYYGFWMDQRVADLLPFDYHPPDEIKK